MIRECPSYSPSTDQVQYLLKWTFSDLEESADRQTAFALLRAVLARRLVVPEVYDVMKRVQEVMVK
jgi:U3 small nucleolar RNA-associated protein 20